MTSQNMPNLTKKLRIHNVKFSEDFFARCRRNLNKVTYFSHYIGIRIQKAYLAYDCSSFLLLVTLRYFMAFFATTPITYKKF